MERITSRHNAIVKRFRELARAAPAADGGDVLLDGAHLVDEALACAVPIEIAAFSDRQIDDGHSPLARTAENLRAAGARVLAVSEDVLAAMSPVQQPSGVVAIARLQPSELPAVFAMPRTRSATQLVLVLAGLQDPGNVGAIIRSAAAFAASGVVAVDGSAHPFGWKALRGAMGGTFRLPIAARGSLAGVVSAARGAGVRIMAAVPRGGTPLPELDLRRPVAIVLGGEGPGVDQDALAASDDLLTIPMCDPVESLNVAIAAALILYEAARQRGENSRQ